MNAIQTFTFQPAQTVRVEYRDDAPFFCLKDVAEILELETRAASKFNLSTKGVEKLSTPSNGGEQQEAVIQHHNMLVKAAPKEKQQRLSIVLWSAVKSKYGVSYKELPPEKFPDILNLMSRVAVEQGVMCCEVLEAEPKVEPKAVTSTRIPSTIEAARGLCDYFEATAAAVASLNPMLYSKTMGHYELMKTYVPQPA